MRKKRNEITTIKVSRKTHEMLELAKNLTFSKSFDSLFRTLEPVIKDFCLQYYANIGDILFKDVKKWEPIKIVCFHPATED